MTKAAVKEDTNHRPTPEEAQAVLVEVNQQRVQACQTELAELLDKHQCRLDPVVVIRGGRVETQIQIVLIEG